MPIDTLPPRTRAKLIAGAGVVIILLGAGAALLPIAERPSGVVIGALLLAAGLIEIGAALLRKDGRLYAIAAGAITSAAGLLFLVNRVSMFLPTINIVAAWLLLRACALALETIRAQGPVRTWLALSAGTDLLLGLLLLAGLSISTLVVGIFGPTPQLVASFAWVFALSFVVTGALMLQIASCERESAQ